MSELKKNERLWRGARSGPEAEPGPGELSGAAARGAYYLVAYGNSYGVRGKRMKKEEKNEI